MSDVFHVRTEIGYISISGGFGNNDIFFAFIVCHAAKPGIFSSVYDRLRSIRTAPKFIYLKGDFHFVFAEWFDLGDTP